MAIKKKDGTIYKLQGPNPIMLTQDFPSEQCDVHNFEFAEFVTKDGMGTAEQEYEVYTPPEMLPPEPPPEAKPVQAQPVEVKQPEKRPSIPKNIPREPAWLLPAEVVEHRDNLYGEVRSYLKYGAKIRGEVILAGGNDLSANLWTNSMQVGKGSIIYLSKEQRWWRVKTVTSKGDGWLYNCQPSDFQPGFDD